MTPERFLKMMRDYFKQEQNKTVRYGTIPGSYVAGRPTVQFDGETAASTKTYPYLSTYTPTAGHRVMLVRDPEGATWVIVGRPI